MRSANSGGAPSGVGEPGHLLAEAVARVRVGQPPHLLLALRLSDTAAPAAEQVAALRGLFSDTARVAGGELHVMANGDLALLAPRPRGGAAMLPAALAAPVGQILGLSAADAARLLASWGLDGPAEGALGYIQARLADARAPGPDAPPAWQHAVRRVAVRLPDGNEHAAIRVLHHVLAPPEVAADDPDLDRHRQAAFGCRLAAELAVGASRLAGFGGAPVHLVLPLRAAAEALAALARQPGLALGVDISCAEAATDPTGFEMLRRLTRQGGIALALCDVDADTLALCEPEALAADLIKLVASPALVDMAPRVAELRAAVGAGRLLLAGADSEERLRWGVGLGIRRFEGAQTDMLLAAARRLVCSHAAGCPLAACAGRARGMGEAVRAGCLNPALLDRAA